MDLHQSCPFSSLAFGVGDVLLAGRRRGCFENANVLIDARVGLRRGLGGKAGELDGRTRLEHGAHVCLGEGEGGREGGGVSAWYV